MTRAKRPILALIISLLLLAAVGTTVWRLPPSHWTVEVMVLAALTIGLWLAGGWISGQRKWTALAISFLMVTLLLNRLGVLNWITLGLWIAILGLISLIN